ncbi:methylated-DNA--[protein]-cysteine S-methyltransferase [Bifidobacterium reuteri]|uniref:Methylated-DNA--protein-cysteine methyltransferase n=1 Tax=Bifidobacterium reuteri TaxID=983706 RepID=A0A5J5EAY9_9BIFI|nr:methylated-DNA--[protein]-cysteine S-methyltransferase [Bifidobacterium reuteri]
MRATVETPIGRMMMTSDGEALTELCLEDWWWAPSGAPQGLDADDTDNADDADAGNADTSDADTDAAEVFRQTRAWLEAYFAGERPELDAAPPLNPHGTLFQREVWDLVAEIPYGQTVSYGELAAELAERRGGGRMAAQAVGGAVKRNPITIIVPCHRVVGAGRHFGGYGGRLDVKAELLEREGVDLGRFDLHAVG